MSEAATAQAGTGDTAAPAAVVDSGAPAAAAVPAPAPAAAPIAEAPAEAPAQAEPPVNRVEQTPQTEQQVQQQQQDWRDIVAGGDKNYAEHLKRFGDPAALGKAYRELHAKMSQGAHKQAGPPQNATPEQLTAWRKETGVPETPEEYTPQLPNGMVLSENDKPIVDHFAKFAHARNWTPAQYNDVLGFYYQTQGAIAQQRQQWDEQIRTQAQAEIRKAWGQDFQRNFQASANFRDAHMPRELQARLLGGRTADGVMIGDDPQFATWFAALAMDFNPQYAVVPAGTSDSSRAIGDEIAEIESMLRDPEGSAKYYKDERKQARYRDLLEARDNAKQKRRA